MIEVSSNSVLAETPTAEYLGSATYSPEDNKLRLYPFARLEPAIYTRVKEAGFSWAPKQELFVAPMWTPSREDLLIELCGEIEPEGTSLAERAEARADRFEGFSARRAHEAESAQRSAGDIAQRFAGGQPILIGHHSERKARKDKERIEGAMNKAIRGWKTSEYWKERAEGARGHADYKADPGVRFRRIKGIEADLRKKKKDKAEAESWISKWETARDNLETATRLANYDHIRILQEDRSYTSLWSVLEKGLMTSQEAAERAARAHQRTIAWADRWITHYEGRLVYERALLEESGATVVQAQTWDIVPGGRVLVKGEWCAVTKVTKREGKILSLTCVRRYVPRVSIEEVQNYEPPTAEAAQAAKALKQLGPIVNRKTEGCIEMTAAEWKRNCKFSDRYGTKKYPANEKHGTYRERGVFGWMEGAYQTKPIFLTDEKVVEIPAPTQTTAVESMAVLTPTPDLATLERKAEARKANQPETEPNGRDKARELEEALKGGIQIVSAHQLFPTPSSLADRMVELADIHCNHFVLEPSAGTGRILEALPASIWNNGEVHAVEINQKLAQGLAERWETLLTSCADFLEWDSQGITFDRILMNPPFERGADIRHILKARELLAPGGILVAICAGGPRQKEALEPLASLWEPLPAGTFEESGTNVNTVLLTIEAPANSLP